MQPKLKAPRTTRLKLKCEKLLSNCAFNFYLRRHTTEPGPGTYELVDPGLTNMPSSPKPLWAGAYTRSLHSST
jgi:hypothetical protein